MLAARMGTGCLEVLWQRALLQQWQVPAVVLVVVAVTGFATDILLESTSCGNSRKIRDLRRCREFHCAWPVAGAAAAAAVVGVALEATATD